MIPSRPPAADVTPRPTGAHLRRARRVTAVGLLAATLVLGGCGSDDGDKADSTAPGTASSTTAAGSTTTAAGGSTSSSEPASQSDVTVYFVRDEKIAATTRSVTGVGIGAAALEAVIAGPNEVESGIGFSNAVPAGTEVLGVNIADGVATVDAQDISYSPMTGEGEKSLFRHRIDGIRGCQCLDVQNVRGCRILGPGTGPEQALWACSGCKQILPAFACQ